MRTWLIISVVLILSVLAVVGYYLLSSRPNMSSTELSQYKDEQTGITFNYQSIYKNLDDLISKENEKVYVKSIQFIPNNGDPKTLPIQATIFAKESSQEEYRAKISEVKQYYKDNGSQVGTINIHGSEVPLFHAEKRDDRTYIIGFYLEEDDFLFLVERYHTGAEKDKSADVVAKDIISTLSY